jgi:hypothetical protein
MKSFDVMRVSALAGFISIGVCSASAVPKKPDATAFTNPPLSAKPRAYWVWINGAITLEQLTRDLEQMKDKSMGGGQM